MNERRAFGFGIAAVLLWSTVATAFKITLEQFTPIQMLTIASIVSACALSIICGAQKKLPLLLSTFSANPLYYITLGLINPLAYYLILFKAYDLLPAAQAQAINYSWAITLTLMAAIFLGQSIRKQDWVACGFSYFGVLVIATQDNLLGLHFQSPLGVVLALISTLLWATYWILNTKNKADPMISLLLGFLIAIPIAIGICFYENAQWSHITIKGWLAVSYAGLFEMGITYVLWLTALRLTSNTSRISNLIFASPFISLILLATIIGEKIHPSTLIGLVFIVIGLVIQQIKFGQRRTLNSCRKVK
ncbi:DMT family transporter [Vibrio sp. S4M6]|uniref:DMT family transporter n=1 Tax=Vibrio sinus TaxID=2946865 RepID=UPI00202A9132|nr:DMT family transporter [Vibrio sinus]MCL9782874.1 DMT family transporter [Vibrio sinus]